MADSLSTNKYTTLISFFTAQSYEEEMSSFARFFQMVYPALQTKSHLATEHHRGLWFIPS